MISEAEVDLVTPGTPDTGRRVVKKVVVSLSLGTLAYLLTAFAQQTQIWGITLSVFVGGVTLVVQFLIEFETRLARVETMAAVHLARIEDIVQDGFAKISTATKLFRLVETSAVPTGAVVDLVQHATLVGREPDLMFQLAQSEIGRLSHLLKELGEREHVSYEGEDRDLLLALTEHATSSIDATSLTTIDARGRRRTDGGFWATDLGQRYLAAQQAAVRRGVRVRRVFVIPHASNDTADTGLSDVWKFHRESGIDVRVLEDTKAGTHLEVNDFVLFDQAVCYETTAASPSEDASRPSRLNTLVELRPDRLADRAQRFEDLWQEAQLPPG